ncbi:PMC2NT domain-containing protein [Cephalotus follicularis]|uniref:PMC2NT domain-containing protein n=1 Tax=Cephalotus follicularis TaxID=3775 RepID=A0A1Q3DB75_CEPFO|nr:PMC2NT domain-containing protein [Cephalotus follicularis]
MEQESPPDNPHSMQTLNDSLSSSLTKLASSSRALPSNKDFHFFNNFNEFKLPIQQISNHSQSLLETLASPTSHSDKPQPFPSRDIDLDTDAYDWLVNYNDEILEKFDVSVHEFQKMRDKGEKMGPDNEGFQLVCGKKKKKEQGVVSGGDAVASEVVVNASSGLKVAVKDKKPKIPFHIPTLRRPQDEFNILVNNANQPFEHVWLQRSEDGTRFVHPLVSIFCYVIRIISHRFCFV